MTCSAWHRSGTHPAGGWRGILILGTAWLFLQATILPVAGSAGEMPAPSSGFTAGASATLEALPEGTRVSSIDLPGGNHATERLSGLPGLGNVGRVAPGIFRGAQPKSEGFETLRRMGIRTVINLRPGRNERGKVEAAGMRLVHVPMKSEDVKPEAVRKAVSILSDPANQPVFVHCKRGKHRAGVVMAVYRMEKEGWSRREAKAEMQVFGYDEDFANLTDLVDRFPAKGTRTR